MPLNEKQTRFANVYIACGGNGRAADIQPPNVRFLSIQHAHLRQ